MLRLFLLLLKRLGIVVHYNTQNFYAYKKPYSFNLYGSYLAINSII